jgi:hypothetical protein
MMAHASGAISSTANEQTARVLVIRGPSPHVAVQHLSHIIVIYRFSNVILTSFSIMIVQCRMGSQMRAHPALPTKTKHRSAALEEEQDSRFGRQVQVQDRE